MKRLFLIAVLLFLNACAFIILSIFADHPCSPVTKIHGDSSILFDTITFYTFSTIDKLHNPSNGAVSSSFCFFSSRKHLVSFDFHVM